MTDLKKDSSGSWWREKIKNQWGSLGAKRANPNRCYGCDALWKGEKKWEWEKKDYCSDCYGRRTAGIPPDGTLANIVKKPF